MSLRSLAVFAACSLVFVACAPAEQERAEATTSQEEAIASYHDQLADSWSEAFNAADAARLAALYTEDAVRMPSDAAPIQGRRAIRRGFQEQFDSFESHEIEPGQTEEIHAAGDWIMERGSWSLRGTLADGGEEIDETGNYMAVSRRGADGQWKLHWEMWSVHQ